MTIYRRRLASSFRALRNTLEARLVPLSKRSTPSNHPSPSTAADDASDDEVATR